MFENPRRATMTLATAAATITMLTAGVATTAAAQSRAAGQPGIPRACHPVRQHAAPPVPGGGLEDLAHRGAAQAPMTSPSWAITSSPRSRTASARRARPARTATRKHGGGVHRQRPRRPPVGPRTASATASPPTRPHLPDRHRQRGRALQRLHDHPGARPAQVRHYRYNKPLPHYGGTDAISVYHGHVLISASAPGTTGKAAPQPSYPAVYSVTFHLATPHRALSGRCSTTRPAPGGQPRPQPRQDGPAGPDRPGLERDRASLRSPVRRRLHADQPGRQGADLRAGAGRRVPQLAVLRLSQSVDDTAWARGRHGRLYGADNGGDTVDVVTGPFRPGLVLRRGHARAMPTTPRPPARRPASRRTTLAR